MGGVEVAVEVLDVGRGGVADGAKDLGGERERTVQAFEGLPGFASSVGGDRSGVEEVGQPQPVLGRRFDRVGDVQIDGGVDGRRLDRGSERCERNDVVEARGLLAQGLHGEAGAVRQWWRRVIGCHPAQELPRSGACGRHDRPRRDHPPVLKTQSARRAMGADQLGHLAFEGGDTGPAARVLQRQEQGAGVE